MPTTQGPVPNQSQIFAALRSFLLDVCPTCEVIQGQANRVPEPVSSDFIIMTMGDRRRLATNIDTAVDAKFSGWISGATMTISATFHFLGSIAIGDQVYGVGTAVGTKVVALGTGTGGVGTYTVSPSQNVGSSSSPIILSTGTKSVLQKVELPVQLDVHGPSSHDNAQIISTLFRDEYATAFFSDLSPAVDVAPLHADDPKQIPFVNDQDQYEDRYVVMARLQANQVVTVPQEFADSVVVELIEADLYPS
jgi:hypothetical protein